MNDRTKIALCLAGALVCIGLAGGGIQLFKGRWQGQDSPTTYAGPALTLNVAKGSASGGVKAESLQEQIEQRYGYITGAVNSPGVYVIPDNARVFHLVEAAGGFRADADQTQINMAAPLKDGAHVHVKSLSGDSSDDGKKANSSSRGKDKAPGTKEMSFVYVNSATERELEELPGVGPSTAKKILEYRQTHGAFGSPEDLLAVDGIGPAKLEKMRQFLRF